MDVKYEISQVTNLTESMMIDCYHIAAQSRPNNADDIYYTLQHNVNNRGHIMFAAIENMNLRGFISGHLISNHGYMGETKIDWLFVDHNHRRRGIANALVRVYMEYCRERGVSRLIVQPAPTIAAKQFYSSQGFEACGPIHMVRDMIKVR